MLRAMIVDDEAPARSELKYLLDETGRVDSVVEASSAREAVERLMGGNAFSPVLLAKGELTERELAGAEPFSGEDGAALRASLSAIGYQPQDWETVLTCDATGEKALEASLLREALCALDPVTLVCCDEASADAVRETYADDLAALDDFEQALLAPGKVAHVCGMIWKLRRPHSAARSANPRSISRRSRKSAEEKSFSIRSSNTGPSGAKP